jgi:ribulose-5-phosphate 4-epimerase/fuculose-1-phosphate aldolase
LTKTFNQTLNQTINQTMPDTMTEAAARDEICRIGKSLFDRGLVHATAGNISMRQDDGILITPSDACLGFLDPARLAKVDLEGHQISGDKASKTVVLHAAIYGAATQFDPNTRCIIHTHSTHAVALTLKEEAKELLPPITPYFVMKVGHVPVVPYHRPGDAAVATQVVKMIEAFGRQGAAIRAVMLSRLGPNVWHDTGAAAMAVLEELEETAKLMCLSATPPTALSAQAIEDLKKTFGARW